VTGDWHWANCRGRPGSWCYVCTTAWFVGVKEGGIAVESVASFLRGQAPSVAHRICLGSKGRYSYSGLELEIRRCIIIVIAPLPSFLFPIPFSFLHQVFVTAAACMVTFTSGRDPHL
jgi:hypothetical protein